MRRVLVTGMSGTGKSTALAELVRRGFEVVDTDDHVEEVEPLCGRRVRTSSTPPRQSRTSSRSWF